MSLREELGAAPLPEFAMTLPPGWSRSAPDEATLERMLAGMRARLMQAGRPDLHAQLSVELRRSFRDMREAGVVAMFAPDPAEADALWLPTSLSASFRVAERGETLDDLARALISQGGTPLLGDKRTIRCERSTRLGEGTDALVQHSVLYLTPVPGARRSRALQLTAGFARPVDMAADAPSLERLRLLLDACVSSLRWQRAAGAEPAGVAD